MNPIARNSNSNANVSAAVGKRPAAIGAVLPSTKGLNGIIVHRALVQLEGVNQSSREDRWWRVHEWMNAASEEFTQIQTVTSNCSCSSSSSLSDSVNTPSAAEQILNRSNGATASLS